MNRLCMFNTVTYKFNNKNKVIWDVCRITIVLYNWTEWNVYTSRKLDTLNLFTRIVSTEWWVYSYILCNTIVCICIVKLKKNFFLVQYSFYFTNISKISLLYFWKGVVIVCYFIKKVLQNCSFCIKNVKKLLLNCYNTLI